MLMIFKMNGVNGTVVSDVNNSLILKLSNYKIEDKEFCNKVIKVATIAIRCIMDNARNFKSKFNAIPIVNSWNKSPSCSLPVSSPTVLQLTCNIQ